ncbi:MAG: TetR/AcrR family transcriptional regulator [Brumimicrobium sp.]
MEDFLSNIRININDFIYLKDPETSVLGKKIIQGSIELIDEIGFDSFNFKKLAEHIQSTEASIYRYFENKNKILLYLTAWYWGWMESKLILSIANIKDAELKLEIAIGTLTEKLNEDNNFSHINEVKLQQIIYSESAKTFLNKHVDEENSKGAFKFYKLIVKRVSKVIKEINPTFKFPNMLVSTIIEGAHLQRFFGDHLPGLTNQSNEKDYIKNFYTDLAFKTIKGSK